jgi:hypothetical protein
MTTVTPSSTPEDKFGTLESLDKIISKIPESRLHPGNKSGVASQAELEKVTENILTQMKLTNDIKNKNKVLASMAILVQEGATSPRFAESYTCEIFDIPVSVKYLRKACIDNKTTVRKIARAIKEQAYAVSSKIQIEGNLAKTFKLQHPDYQMEELYWVSDQTKFSNFFRKPGYAGTC